MEYDVLGKKIESGDLILITEYPPYVFGPHSDLQGFIELRSTIGVAAEIDEDYFRVGLVCPGYCGRGTLTLRKTTKRLNQAVCLGSNWRFENQLLINSSSWVTSARIKTIDELMMDRDIANNLIIPRLQAAVREPKFKYSKFRPKKFLEELNA
jgi:hypothetical protein